MRIQQERCLQCSTLVRPTNLPDEYFYLLRIGNIIGTGFWACSIDCYKKLLIPYISEPTYYPDSKIEDDPEVRDCIKKAKQSDDEYTSELCLGQMRFRTMLWEEYKWFAIKDAEKALYQRLVKEEERINKEKDEEWAEYQAKKQERKDKQLEADRREFIRLKEKVERELYREQRERERLEEKQAREDEKQRKLDEAEAARLAEEAHMQELIAPKQIPQYLRLEHTHILGPSGSGKTSLIEHIILNDFIDHQNKPFHDPTAYVIIDPKGLMVERLSRLAIFHSTWRDRIVIIDPFDQPALNMFDPRGTNVARIVSDFSYIFSTSRQKLTGKQAVCFAFCASVLFRVPGANLFTLLELLDDATDKKKTRDPRFAQAIASFTLYAEQSQRRFFETDYYQNYDATRQEIKSRVWDVLHNEYLGVMLNAPERRFDIAACIRDRKTVLVNTRMVDLKNAHQTLGRFIITLVADAIRARSERHPVYLVIDEFQEFADVEKTPEMLRLIREYGGGAVLAHQNMYCAEFDDAIRSAISTNTSIKYASSPRGMDIGYMARDMQCHGDFLSRQCVKSADTARFACFFTGLQHPFIKEFPFGEIAGLPRISDADYESFRGRNRAALHSRPEIYEAHEIEAVREVMTPPESPPETPRTETPPPRSAQIETRTAPPRPPAAPTMHPRSAAAKNDPAEPSDSW